MKKKYNFDAKEILEIIDKIPKPTPYDIDRAKVAAITCRTAKEFAEFLELDVLVFKAWCNRYQSYLKAVSSWRDHATNEIEVALARKAIGFKKTTKRDVLTKTGTVETLEIETYYPPDPTAAQFWLKNRAPNDWQDKKEIDVNLNANIRAWLVSAGGAIDPSEIIEGVSTEVVRAELEDHSQQELEAALISDLIAEQQPQPELQPSQPPEQPSSNTFAPEPAKADSTAAYGFFNSKWD